MLVDELTYKISKTTFWSDAQTILQYIKNESKRFQTYVANRVAEIREVTSPDQWRHCPGKVNPADDASRSLKPSKISCQHRWWRGPEFLWEAEECWPGVVTYGEVPDSDPEVRISANVHPISVETRRIGTPTECSENDNASEDSHAGLSRLIESCRSWLTLQSRVAWTVRFCQWVADKRIVGSTGPLTLEELNKSTEVIVRCVQNESFPEDVKEVKLNKEVKKSSKLGKHETSISRWSTAGRRTIAESCGTLVGRETSNGSTKAPSREPVDCSSLP